MVQPEVPGLIGGLRPPRGERDELIAHIDERHPTSCAAAELEVEQASVPRQRLLDVVDLESYVVDAEQTRHARASLLRRLQLTSLRSAPERA